MESRGFMDNSGRLWRTKFWFSVIEWYALSGKGDLRIWSLIKFATEMEKHFGPDLKFYNFKNGDYALFLMGGADKESQTIVLFNPIKQKKKTHYLHKCG